MINTPTFIINLKNDSEKKEYMQQHCESMGLNPIFIETIYGKDLSLEYLDSVYDEQRAIATLGRPLSRGEIGCSLSHLSVYQTIINEKLPFALILEDDIIIKPPFTKMIKSLINENNLFNKDIILLGHHARQSRIAISQCSFYNRKPLIPSYKIMSPIEPAYGTYGYIVTLRGAQKLLAYNQIISLPIDCYTGNRTFVDITLVMPPIVIIHEEFSNLMSNITTDRNLLEKKYMTKESKGIKKILTQSSLLRYLRNFQLFLTRRLQLFYKQITR